MKNLLKLIVVVILLFQITDIFAQSVQCTPGCSKIANGNFEQPNTDSLSSQGLDSYGGAQYPGAGFPFNLGHVCCWDAFELSPHIWPTDTSSSLNHFSVYGSIFSVLNGNVFELSEKSAYTQEFCLDSGAQYKIRYNFYAYLPEGNITPYWEGWWTFNFTDNINYNIYAPSGSDDVISSYLIGNDSYNPNILTPPSYLSINWHYNESNPFTYRNQEYLVLAPKINPNLADGNYGTGIFIDNIEFIPYIIFQNYPLCDSASTFVIYTDSLNPNIDLEYSAVSPNVVNCINLGDSCIITVSGMTLNSTSEIVLAYTITDTACNGNSCVMQDTLIMQLNQYLQMSLNTIQLQEVSCNPNCDGMAQVTVYNGVSPFQYTWSNSTTSYINNTLCAGLNYVTVTDALGCWRIDSVLVTDTAQFEILGYMLGKCACDDSSYAFIPLDSMQYGVAPYSYNWFTNPIQTSDTLWLNGPGVYSVAITDSLGCSDTLQFEEYCIELDSFTIHNSHCEASCDGWIGAISVNWLGTCPPCPDVTYLWSNGLTSYGEDVTGFCPGLYTVTITDCNGNNGVDTVLIGFDFDPYLTASINGVSCSDTCDGFVEVTLINSPSAINDFSLSNSNGYYQFQDNVNIPLAEFDSLCLGNYTIIVSDRFGCGDTLFFNLPSEFNNSSTLITNSCSLNSTISIDITTNGPNAPFTYNWSNGSTTQDVTVSSPGNYFLTTTNVQGCEIIDTFYLDTIPLSLGIIPFHPTCATFANGYLECVPSGGMPPYYYSWSTGASTSIITNLSPGTYYVTVTDSYGCSVYSNASLVDYLYLEATMTVFPPTCPDINNNSNPGYINLNIQDGISPYSFIWSNNETTQNLTNASPGYYSVPITDAVGCQIILSDSVPPVSLIVDIDDIGQGCSDTTTLLLENGYATANITGGAAPYTYLWSNAATGQTAYNLLDFAYYSVIVTDANGCTGIGEIEVKSKQTINLLNGHGIWSTYIDLESQGINVSSFFNSNGLSSSIILMKNSAGLVYWPLYGLSFPYFINGEAYYIKMPSTGNYSFSTTGNIICPEDFDLSILQGWSYRAYLRTTPSSASFELAPIVSSIIIVKNSAGAIYWPLYNLNMIGNLNPGEGYQFNMSSTVSFNYSPNSSNYGTKTTDSYEYPIPNNQDIITDKFMVLGIPKDSWITEPEYGSLIIAKGEKGQIVGRVYYFAEFTAMCLYGDDSSTPFIKEGLNPGEYFTLEIFSESTKTTSQANLSLKSWEQGDGRFANESIALLKTRDIDIEVPGESYIGLQVNPNPNTGQFRVQIQSTVKGQAEIKIFDNLGKILYISENLSIIEGINLTEFNLMNAQSGTYFLEITIGNNKEHTIFTIAK